MEIKQLGNIAEENGFKNPQVGRVYDSDGIAPTINTMQGGQRQPKIICASRGRDKDNPPNRTTDGMFEQRLECNGRGISNTLTSVQKDNLCLEANMIGYQIRKLTPLECFRLMGVTDDDAKKMLAINGNSQCYKQAGNSIVVDVLVAMFRQLFPKEEGARSADNFLTKQSNYTS